MHVLLSEIKQSDWSVGSRHEHVLWVTIYYIIHSIIKNQFKSRCLYETQDLIDRIACLLFKFKLKTI